MARAYLSLGSADPEPQGRLDQAERFIAGLGEIEIVRRSNDFAAEDSARGKPLPSLYRVVAIDTAIKARALLDACIGVEKAMGRDHRDVWGPRLIDIDLIAYDDIEIRSSRLNIPHAFAHTRPHIIGPLREIAPDTAEWVVQVLNRPR